MVMDQGQYYSFLGKKIMYKFQPGDMNPYQEYLRQFFFFAPFYMLYEMVASTFSSASGFIEYSSLLCKSVNAPGF